jgi:glycosyltransferase involved in cell wall biosynthesis
MFAGNQGKLSMKRKIKVFHLINSFEVGGLEKLLYYFLKNMDFNRFFPIVGVLNQKGSLKRDFESLRIPIYGFGLKPGIDFSVIPRILRIMREQKVDVLHTHNLGPHFYGSLAALIAGISLKVHTEHGISASLKGKNILKHRYLDRKRDYVVAVSPLVQDYLKLKWKPRCVLLTILNGIEVNYNNEYLQRKNEYRRIIGAQPEDKIIGQVARISEVKDQSMLLRAFNILYHKHRNYRLLIVGDGPLIQRLVNEAKSLKIENRVHFLGERNDVKDFLSIFDVFALSSTSEGISIALLEAMAQGIVPVVTAVGGNCVVVNHGVNGLLSSPGDEEKFAENISTVLEDDDKKRRLAKNAINIVKSKFNIKKMVESYQSIYSGDIFS